MLLHSLEKNYGHKVARVSIQDPIFDWNTTDMVIICSAWDKYNYFDEYVRILDMIAASKILLNPRKLLAWHSNKADYLMDLQNAGIHLPPTAIFDPWIGGFPSLKEIMDAWECDRLVLKPESGNAGAGIRLVDRYETHKYDALFEELADLAEEDAEDEEEFDDNRYLDEDEEPEKYVVQCFQYQIQTKGERSLIIIGGKATHAVLKEPAQNQFLVHEGFGGTTTLYEPTQEEIYFAMKVHNAVKFIVGETPAYLRVDMIYDNDDELALMELAAGTAQLWLTKNPPAADVFAEYVDGVLRKSRLQKSISFSSSLPMEGEETCAASNSTATTAPMKPATTSYESA